ncbi:ketosteroid isomerase [Cytophagales bacterium WSM2-2]|nr:ketosteroid isomerase [Cytophagales bacterium WSM2-2]
MEQLIHRFYKAFQDKDWKTMQLCYHDEIVFNDPVFQNLKGNEAKAMWHMLVEAGKDLTLTFSDIKANAQEGSCHWEAFYTFSKTGKKVHNIIDASFQFKDEKIFRHTDSFDLWRWSRMAMGSSGLILGWTPILRNKVRSIARSNLEKFMKSNGY